jgi:hypothetical protein
VDPEEYLRPNPEIPPGEQELVDEGEPGFTADVTRVITYPDGTQESQVWTWTYDPHSIIYEVHPCEIPEDHPEYEAGIDCPVLIPYLGNLTLAEATDALNALGIFIAVGEPFPVGSPNDDGTVRAQDVPPDTWLEPGETVTVRLGEYTAPDDE